MHNSTIVESCIEEDYFLSYECVLVQFIRLQTLQINSSSLLSFRKWQLRGVGRLINFSLEL